MRDIMYIESEVNKLKFSIKIWKIKVTLGIQVLHKQSHKVTKRKWV